MDGVLFLKFNIVLCLSQSEMAADGAVYVTGNAVIDALVAVIEDIT